MKLFKFLFILSLFSATVSFAQTRAIDSIKKVYLREAAIRNPVLRRAIISTDIISRTRIDSKLYGNKLFDGKMSQVRTSALVNVPVKSWKKNSISASFSFFNQYLDVNHISSPLADTGKIQNGYTNKLTVGATLSYQRVDSLFGRRVIYTGSLTALTGDASAIQKVSFLGGMIFMLRQTRSTSISAGLLANIDPSVNIPVVPLFIYWHKFKNDLELSVNLPQQATLRKSLSKNCWASFGTSLSTAISFFQNEKAGAPKNIIFSTVDLKTGPGLECRMGKIFMLGLNAGVMTPVMSRLYERGKSSNNYILGNKINTTPFANVTISVLPF